MKGKMSALFSHYSWSFRRVDGNANGSGDAHRNANAKPDSGSGSVSHHGHGHGYGRGYSQDVEKIREVEYPLLKDTTYLDHAGTTLYARSLIESFSRDLTSNLFGNPHSASASSQLSTRRVDDVRLRALRFFNADPDHFDLVFVANATAGIKLVGDALRDYHDQNRPRTKDEEEEEEEEDVGSGFWYGYHLDAHTSLVGVRELAQQGHRCFVTDEEVDGWIRELRTSGGKNTPKLFAFPAQSNMTGRRLPLRWCEEIRTAAAAGGGNVFTLLDAASLVSTSPLDLSNVSAAPDFIALSFYKIFGFPDLGALIVRKSAGHVLRRRRYFGGGTVGMVIALGEPWHAKKDTSVHDHVEDGTLPFHNIIALDSAFETHKRLYGSMANVSAHTRYLAKRLADRLSSLRHYNGAEICQLYTSPSGDYTDPSSQGPIVTFNLRNSRGEWVGKSVVEKVAGVKNIQIRSGSLCNPGGTAYHVGLNEGLLRRAYAEGVRCGDENDIVDGMPLGALRVSLGAMSSLGDVDRFLEFIEEFYVEKSSGATNTPVSPPPPPPVAVNDTSTTGSQPRFYVESLCVYPIKSCGGFKVPEGKRWEVRKEGLVWDREWCLIHQGTGVALSQKRFPRMALIRPYIDLDRGVLRVTCGGAGAEDKSLEISLARDDPDLIPSSMCQNSTMKTSTVCGDQVIVQTYSSPAVSAFFSDFLGIPCTLARFPPDNAFQTRHSKPRRRLQGVGGREKMKNVVSMPDSFPQGPSPRSSAAAAAASQERQQDQDQKQNPILLSNESPILLISRSSVNRLNETIKAKSKNKRGGISRTIAADVFRANIVVAENLSPPSRTSSSTSSSSFFSSLFSPVHSRNKHAGVEQPFIEDKWTSLRICSSHSQPAAQGPSKGRDKGLLFDVLGSCQRCQMVCVDQFTGTRNEEPFTTLAKTRKIDGKVLFGRHICLSSSSSSEMMGTAEDGEDGGQRRTVMVGDAVVPFYE
ncbi:hypothetical protein VTN02DRAFT_5875 [Thermoascus thermophilus]